MSSQRSAAGNNPICQCGNNPICQCGRRCSHIGTDRQRAEAAFQVYSKLKNDSNLTIRQIGFANAELRLTPIASFRFVRKPVGGDDLKIIMVAPKRLLQCDRDAGKPRGEKISRCKNLFSPLHKLLKASARSHFAIAEVLRT